MQAGHKGAHFLFNLLVIVLAIGYHVPLGCASELSSPNEHICTVEEPWRSLEFSPDSCYCLVYLQRSLYDNSRLPELDRPGCPSHNWNPGKEELEGAPALKYSKTYKLGRFYTWNDAQEGNTDIEFNPQYVQGEYCTDIHDASPASTAYMGGSRGVTATPSAVPTNVKREAEAHNVHEFVEDMKLANNLATSQQQPVPDSPGLESKHLLNSPLFCAIPALRWAVPVIAIFILCHFLISIVNFTLQTLKSRIWPERLEPAKLPLSQRRKSLAAHLRDLKTAKETPSLASDIQLALAEAVELGMDTEPLSRSLQVRLTRLQRSTRKLKSSSFGRNNSPKMQPTAASPSHTASRKHPKQKHSTPGVSTRPSADELLPLTKPLPCTRSTPILRDECSNLSDDSEDLVALLSLDRCDTCDELISRCMCGNPCTQYPSDTDNPEGLACTLSSPTSLTLLTEPTQPNADSAELSADSSTLSLQARESNSQPLTSPCHPNQGASAELVTTKPPSDPPTAYKPNLHDPPPPPPPKRSSKTHRSPLQRHPSHDHKPSLTSYHSEPLPHCFRVLPVPPPPPPPPPGPPPSPTQLNFNARSFVPMPRPETPYADFPEFPSLTPTSPAARAFRVALSNTRLREATKNLSQSFNSDALLPSAQSLARGSSSSHQHHHHTFQTSASSLSSPLQPPTVPTPPPINGDPMPPLSSVQRRKFTGKPEDPKWMNQRPIPSNQDPNIPPPSPATSTHASPLGNYTLWMTRDNIWSDSSSW